MKTISKSEFYTVVKGANFMTPEGIAYYKHNNLYRELSKGTGMSGEPIYGVSTFKKLAGEDVEVVSEQSEMFYSLDEAKAFHKSHKLI